MTNRVLLVSLYELGRQSFGVASAAAFLEKAGAKVLCQDLSIESIREGNILEVGCIGIYLPMHTATRMAVSVIERIREWDHNVPICCFGLYAPLNEHYLHRLGVDATIGGEFEEALVRFYKQSTATSSMPKLSGMNNVSLIDEPIDSNDILNRSEAVQVCDIEPAHAHSMHSIGKAADLDSLAPLAKLQFFQPLREQLPSLDQYAYLSKGDDIRYTVGYTEASRGCKHLCRHCPVVPVYNGAFRIVQKDVVLADIRQQVVSGAAHITFGDPDFFNGPGHAMAIVEAIHAEFPTLTYDVTIKVEHLLKHPKLLRMLRDTGCLFITSAVESFEDHVLERLEKGHTYADFLEAKKLCLSHEVFFHPTFIAFHPWQSVEGYIDFLSKIAQLSLVESLAPIQYAIRLLIPTGSRLLALDEVQAIIEPFDDESLAYPWKNPKHQVDQLQEEVLSLVQSGEKTGLSRSEIFLNIWQAAENLYSQESGRRIEMPQFVSTPIVKPVPRLSEHWYC